MLLLLSQTPQFPINLILIYLSIILNGNALITLLASQLPLTHLTTWKFSPVSSLILNSASFISYLSWSSLSFSFAFRSLIPQGSSLTPSFNHVHPSLYVWSNCRGFVLYTLPTPKFLPAQSSLLSFKLCIQRPTEHLHLDGLSKFTCANLTHVVIIPGGSSS